MHRAKLMFLLYAFMCVDGKACEKMPAGGCGNEMIDHYQAAGKLRQFFECFPESEVVFTERYGNFDPDTYKPLQRYDKALEDIQTTLPRTRVVVGDDIYNKKIIDLALGLKWEADAPNYFQKLVINEIESHNMLSTLDQYDTAAVKTFWRFMLDGPAARARKLSCDTAHRSCQVLKVMRRTGTEAVKPPQ